ncbi:MAG: Flp family type IVb pilin [Candidatus Melainabacteria bacterium]
MLKLYVKFQTMMATSKKGQSLAEYGLILALVAIVCIAGLETMGGNLKKMLEDLAGSLAGVKTTP